MCGSHRKPSTSSFKSYWGRRCKKQGWQLRHRSSGLSTTCSLGQKITGSLQAKGADLSTLFLRLSSSCLSPSLRWDRLIRDLSRTRWLAAAEFFVVAVRVVCLRTLFLCCGVGPFLGSPSHLGILAFQSYFFSTRSGWRSDDTKRYASHKLISSPNMRMIPFVIVKNNEEQRRD
jgi:hypothetical protein